MNRDRAVVLAFTLAATAFPVCLLNFIKRGESGVHERLAIGTFAAANVIIGAIFIGTVWLLVRGKLFPAVAPRPPA